MAQIMTSRHLNFIYSNSKFEAQFSKLTKKGGAKTRLFCDIETFKSNTIKALKKRSDYSVHTWSLCVGLFGTKTKGKDTVYLGIYKNFTEFFEFLDRSLDTRKKLKKKHKLEFLFHNAQGYDSHFMLSELTEYTNTPAFNKYQLKSSHNGYNAKKKKDITASKNYCILESRVKSKTKLALSGRLSGFDFETVDTFPKAQSSLAKIGKTLNKTLHKIPKKFLKTTLDYTQFDTGLYLSDKEVLTRIRKIWKDYITDKIIEYILNDVILLASFFFFYNDLYPSFDWDKFSLSSNVLEEFRSYKVLSEWQLTHNSPVPTWEVKPSDVMINSKETLREFNNRFYHGGFNAYNDQYIEQLIEGAFSIDLNQSYPTQMYKHKFPTYYLGHVENKKIKVSEITNNPDRAYLVRISRDDFTRLLKKEKSVLKRKFFTKRFASPSDDDYIHLTSIDLQHFNQNTTITAIFMTIYETEYFASRDLLFENFKVKSQAKLSLKKGQTITYSTPFEYEIIDEPYPIVYSENDVIQAKLKNNTIYGATVLREYYPLAVKNKYQEYEIFHDGVKNSERNNLFGLWVTSLAFKNLLEPLLLFKPQEIDRGFIYADTDSLYLKDFMLEKVLTSGLINTWALGGWDLEHRIKYIWINNHKKYMLEDSTTGEHIVHAGGISMDTQEEIQKEDLPFLDKAKKYMSAGSKFKNTKSMLTKGMTIAIYENETQLTPAKPYRDGIDMFSDIAQRIEIMNAKTVITENDVEDGLYYEGTYGAYSILDIMNYGVPADHSAVLGYSLEDYQDFVNETKGYFRIAS